MGKDEFMVDSISTDSVLCVLNKNYKHQLDHFGCQLRQKSDSLWIL